MNGLSVDGNVLSSRPSPKAGPENTLDFDVLELERINGLK